MINVCKEENVSYFIYCGSSGIFNGPEEVKAGTETTVQSPSKLGSGFSTTYVVVFLCVIR
jgi:hypothetical protein